MKFLQPLLFAAPLFSLSAAKVSLDLAIAPTSRANFTYRVGTQLTPVHQPASFQDISTGVTDYSGNLTADATIDTDSDSLTSVQFTGGEITSTGSAGNLTVSVGSVPFTVIFETANITRTASSSALDMLPNGFLDGELHFTTLTGGTLSVLNFQNSNPIETVVVNDDFSLGNSGLIADESLFPDLSSTSGPISISLTRTAATPLAVSYDALLFTIIQVPAKADALLQVAGQPLGNAFRQRYFEAGTLTASTSVVALTPFGEWALANGLTLTTGLERNEAGMSYALLFALGLSPETSALPFTLQAPTPEQATLQLPADGLRRNVRVQYSPDLVTPFSNLPLSALLDGPQSLSRGQTGSARISLPAGQQGFLRIATTP